MEALAGIFPSAKFLHVKLSFEWNTLHLKYWRTIMIIHLYFYPRCIVKWISTEKYVNTTIQILEGGVLITFKNNFQLRLFFKNANILYVAQIKFFMLILISVSELVKKAILCFLAYYFFITPGIVFE